MRKGEVPEGVLKNRNIQSEINAEMNFREAFMRIKYLSVVPKQDFRTLRQYLWEKQAKKRDAQSHPQRFGN